MSFEISGFDQLQKQLEEASRALAEVDGEITTINFSPNDQSSVEAAIAEMERAIDNKLSSFDSNPLVRNLAIQLKAKYQEQILERAMDAKATGPQAPMAKTLPEEDLFRQIENTVADLRQSGSNVFNRHIEKLSRLLHAPALEVISNELAEAVDVEALLQAGYATGRGMAGSARLAWPTDPKQELGLVVSLIDRFAKDSDAAFQFSFTFFYKSNNITVTLQNMAAQMIVPFTRDYVDYVKRISGAKDMALPLQGIEPAARKAFVVHGHDEGVRESVARFLESIGFEAIILHEQANQGRTIIEKIEAHGDVGFAVVLLTPDDEGCALGGSANPRARQNVLLELGYFIGRLGRHRVCALKKGELEVPSDFAGVVYEPFDANNGWKVALGRELQAAGFDVDWNRIHK